MRNKLGGTVFSKNRGGAYSKTLVIPANPSSSGQVTKRSNFKAVSQAWKGLTDAQRLSWENAVDNWKRTDIFANIRVPSGFSLYMRINIQLLRVGSAQRTTPPVPAKMPFVPSLSNSFTAAGTSLFVLPTAPVGYGAGFKMVIRVTKPVSAGVKFVKNLFADIMVSTAGGTSPFSITAAYALKYGVPAVGTKIASQVLVVNITSGQTSNALSAITIVS